jgi:hypothetical protein
VRSLKGKKVKETEGRRKIRRWRRDRMKRRQSGERGDVVGRWVKRTKGRVKDNERRRVQNNGGDAREKEK